MYYQQYIQGKIQTEINRKKIGQQLKVAVMLASGQDHENRTESKLSSRSVDDHNARNQTGLNMQLESTNKRQKIAFGRKAHYRLESGSRFY